MSDIGFAPALALTCNSYEDRPLSRIPINFKASDQNILRGSVCLILYVGVWLISVVSVPVSIILLFTGCVKTSFALLFLMICCFIIPVKPWQPLRVWVRSNLGRYFREASIRFEHVPDKYNDTPTILSVHPHGVFSLAWAQCYLTDEVIVRLTGYPSNVRKKTIKEHMRNGESIAIIPGGWHEATIHNHKVDRIYIKARTGFIKYAVQFGYTITPCYAFGERSTYANVQGVVPWGRKCFPFFPRDSKLHTVVAQPVHLPYNPNPSPEVVEAAHKMYMKAVIEVFDAYKVKFYGKEAESLSLEIW